MSEVNVQDASIQAALGTEIKPTPGVRRAPVVKTTTEFAATVTQKAVEQRQQETPTLLEVVPTDTEAQVAIKARFTGERNAAGTLKDAKQAALEARTIKEDALTRKFAKEGLGAITTPAEQKIIIDQIDARLDLIPGLNVRLPKGSAQREAYIRDWLKDPNNAEFYQKLIIKEKAVAKAPASEDEISEARQAYKDLEGQRAQLGLAAADVQTKIETIDTKLMPFEVDAVGIAGTSLAQIRTLEGTIAPALTEIAQMQEDLNLTKSRIQLNAQARQGEYFKKLDPALQAAELTRLNSELARLQQAETDAITAIRAKEAVIAIPKADLATLKKQEQDLRTQREGALTAWESDIAEYEGIENKLQQASNDLLAKVGKTDSLPDAIDNTIGDTFQALIEERLSANSQIVEADLVERAKNEVDKYKKAVKDALIARYYKNVDSKSIRGSHSSKDYDKGQIRSDYGTLLTDGPNALIRDYLISSGMTDAEADAKLKDNAFVAEMSPLVVERVLALRVKTAKISEGEAGFIYDSEWGGKAMIDKAIAERKDIQGMLDNLQSQGIIEGKTISALRKAGKGTFAAVLIAILLGVNAAQRVVNH